MITLQDANTIVPVYAISYVRFMRQENGEYSVIMYLNNGEKITLPDQPSKTFEQIKSMVVAYEAK